MILDASTMNWQQLNEAVRNSEGDLRIIHCLGERFIGSGLSGRCITLEGTPGNALGAYLNGGELVALQNVQDAVGDTMNDGKIVVHGSAGDALGYAMRGGCIFVKGDAGYRTGVHMKEFGEKRPAIVIGGRVGSFLGEYLAGGRIIVLGIGYSDVPAGNFIGTGMHGGEIWLRSKKEPANLPPQVRMEKADPKMLEEIDPLLREYANCFEMDFQELETGDFYRLTPNAQNPYKRLYTAN